MGVEQNISQALNRHPGAKKAVKRLYQRIGVACAKPVRSEGDIVRLSPEDPTHEYFFGYYDKTPWDATERFVLCMRADDAWSGADNDAPADILLIDTSREESDPERVTVLDTTRAWNVQQGCMLQWLGPDFVRRIAYNDFRRGRYVTVILDLETMEEREVRFPSYVIARDGDTALSLDFARLHVLRPGYGYANKPPRLPAAPLPNGTAIWRLSLDADGCVPVLDYARLAVLSPNVSMSGSNVFHKVNHIMINPSGTRFMFLHRWLRRGSKRSRLIACDMDGGDMRVLLDDGMVSHCCWRDDNSILSFANVEGGGLGYYLVEDSDSPAPRRVWPSISEDGHPTYSPQGRFVISDTYPNRYRIQELRLLDQEAPTSEAEVLARVFAPFKYDGDTRCDLHPRWSPSGERIAFDATFEGSRGLYFVEVPMGARCE